MKTPRIVVILCLILSVISAASCTLERRKPLEISGYNQEPIRINSRIVVFFSPVVAEKPLKETVWDNTSGPIWSPEESKQIGFTQHYKAQFFAIPPALLPSAAQAGVNLIDTRIVIPFGNIFVSVFESALAKSTEQHDVCFDSSCLSRFEKSAVNTLQVRIEKFFVWEYPLNHLNFYLSGSSFYGNEYGLLRAYPFEFQLLKFSLGSIMSTHAHFMKQMNLISNEFAERAVADILRKTVVSTKETI